jgi:hypothetical protein
MYVIASLSFTPEASISVSSLFHYQPGTSRTGQDGYGTDTGPKLPMEAGAERVSTPVGEIILQSSDTV